MKKNDYDIELTGLGSLRLGGPAQRELQANGEYKNVQLNKSSGLLGLGTWTTERRDALSESMAIQSGSLIYNETARTVQLKIEDLWVDLFEPEQAALLPGMQNLTLQVNQQGLQIIALNLAILQDQQPDEQNLHKYLQKSNSLHAQMSVRRPVQSGNKGGAKKLTINAAYLDGSYANCLIRVNSDATAIVASTVVQDVITLDQLINRENLLRVRNVAAPIILSEESLDIYDLIDPEIFTIENANKLLKFDETGTKIGVCPLIATKIFTIYGNQLGEI